MTDILETCFAPARRSEKCTIACQIKLLSKYYGSLKQLYDAVSEIILIVNQDRQIVFFNSVVPSLLNIDDPESIYGKRPGEALGCINACKTSGGCGTSEFCSQCGAVNAILASLSNKADLQECRLLTQNNVEAMDLLVRTSPLEIQGQMFAIVAIIDISHEKRRRALERIFFHDIMNTATSINLFANMLNDETDEGNAAILRQNLLAGSKQLMDELDSQKVLLAAENNDLVVHKRPVDACSVLREVVEVYRGRFRQHRILVNIPDEKIMLNTAHGLLYRILGNMIQNAIEASNPGENVQVSCAVDSEHAEFFIHNQSHIPKNIQLRIFQRSFSTKGPDRGLGTYSMKLLCERYLDGSICLHSSPERGTTFTARFPL